MVNLLKSTFPFYTLQATWKHFRNELMMNKLFINYISRYNSENIHLSQRFSTGLASGLRVYTGLSSVTRLYHTITKFTV